MSKTTADTKSLYPHIALIPSAGMGHLLPFLRIASTLLSRNCTVTLITAKPIVSAAESSHISAFLSQHPQVKHVDFQTIQSHNPTADDPFYLQYESITRSAHLLYPLLSSSSLPFSAIFADFIVASSITPMAAELGIPSYIICTTSIKFFCLIAYLPVLVTDPAKLGNSSTELIIPGLTPFPVSSIPPPFKNPNHLFTRCLALNAKALSKAEGIIVNSVDFFEKETLEEIKNGRVLENSLPSFLPIGPLASFEIKKDKGEYMSWLDNQPEESVVYVSFGSRTAISRDQIREVSKGLERSGHRFLWVVKSTTIDKEDKDELKDLLGRSFLERTMNKGMAVKEWVSQEEILAHTSIGAFVSHCGWNSVIEAARQGVPMVAWPQHGDQKVNAEIVEKAGLGIWERNWGWADQAELVCGEEIGEKIREVMEDEKLREKAKKVGEEARKATKIGGKSEKVLKELLELLQ
ncbi:UDP-glycosyltransferase [Morus notabilis]|uniref:Glycosyltransferase n=2 Tax=Morus notabilis TaxID=981085 RepID=W9QTE0_9ROSA|nr:UDP-glycosyltransferase 13 [Morus notabilis]EXB38050.1 UDP-glycosyltransferase [Morus notabilis]